MAKKRKGDSQQISKERPQINVAFIGHVDHGKSTLVSRILLDTNSIDPHLIDEYRRIAEEQGKPGFELAYVMDDLPEERSRGITIRSQIKEFDTSRHHFTISDAPGHADFISNMIKGTSQAESAVLLVDAKEGVKPQTKEHLILAYTFGVEQLLVAVNKMDATQPPFNQTQYDIAVSQVEEVLREIGYRKEQYTFVPVSAYQGENISTQSKSMGWYSGRTLLNLMDEFSVAKRYDGFPLRWPLRENMKVSGVGYIPVGHVYSGTIKPGDEIVFMPGNNKAVVKTLEKHGNSVNIGRTGDPVGANLRLIGNWDKSKRNLRSGHVAGLASDPPTVAERFTAQVVLMNPLSDVFPGYAPVIHVHEAHVKAQMESLNAKFDPQTMQVVEKNPDYLRKGDIAEVTFKPFLPLVIEPVDRIPPLGRFAMRDSKQTIGAGRVISVEPREY